MFNFMLHLLTILFLFGEDFPPSHELASLVRATPEGGILRLPPGAIFRLSTSVVITKPIIIEGNGSRIVALNGAKIDGALISSEGINRVEIHNLVLDANIDHAGADYGIWIKGGTGHRIDNTTIQNSAQACLFFEDASGIIKSNQLDKCGRDLTVLKGTAANNHGIMIVALKQHIRNVFLDKNIINNAYRKGITTYARGEGYLSNIVISNNNINECGLGGIYIANAPSAKEQRNILLKNNSSKGNYVNFQIDDVKNLKMIGNYSGTTHDRSKYPGAQGLVLNNVDNALISGMVVSDSGSGGVLVHNSARVKLLSPMIINPNSGGAGFGPGLHFSHTKESVAENISVIDNRVQHLVTHGFVSNDGSQSNAVTIRRVEGVAPDKVRLFQH